MAAAVPRVRVGDVDYNVSRIKALVEKAAGTRAEIVCFPELCLTGYTCQDLFLSAALLDRTEKALEDLEAASAGLPLAFIVGAPVRRGNRLANAAVVMAGGARRCVEKLYYPNYGEFYEKRWFSPGPEKQEPLLFELPSGVRFAVEICEDLWAPVPPSSSAAAAGADIIFNLSASDELAGKHRYLLSLLSQQSARCLAGYVYSSAGFGESTQDVVYGGNALVYENGVELAAGERFSLDEQLVTAQIDVERLRAERMTNTTFREAQIRQGECRDTALLDCRPAEGEVKLERSYNPYPFIPEAADMNEACNEIFSIQVTGLAKRLSHTKCRDAVIGVSGGLDSTLALLVSVAAFDKLGLDRKGVHGITMPGFGTTSRTHDNAVKLMTSLGVSQAEIPISDAVRQHFRDIGHDGRTCDVTYENSQARYRTMVLMDTANRTGGLVIGTGDLSELALGWCTYNGDHMSMYAVNAGVPKTLVRHLVEHFALSAADADSRKTLLDIINTPISPELLPAGGDGDVGQKTEDIVGPYELHDFFLYHFMRFGFSGDKLLLLAARAFDGSRGPKYDPEVIRKWMKVFFRRFFSQQFKRSCLPDGPKVGSVSLSPRGDWRMPSDACPDLWIED